MASIIYTIILIISLLFLIRKKDDFESYFLLKIMGFFILGSFAFHFNQISLPLGFLVFLLFFRPKLNVDVKRKAAVYGVLAFMMVNWILPYAVNVWESRPIFIEHKFGSIYTMNFLDEYELVWQELKLENNDLRLEDFEVDYDRDGKITDLEWQLLGQNDKSYNHYQIRYESDKSRYRVTFSQLDTWLQYNRLIEAGHFFEILNVLDIKGITHSKGDFSSYGIKSTGERVNYGMENRTHFTVLNAEIQTLSDEQLPVEGYYISTFAMQKSGEERDKRGNIIQESFEGAKPSDYLFDVNFDGE
ncbi:hypothetical protein [Neobacillus kokaensis]|uniref:Uncharacterized protein n=1 Tax=Neobacillus kokaensis TaxID=2759023 RepID=A0ABQ3N9M1_9BACI|nr:hypothetical protein [Neobacillus kokaensis]GHI00997.1 hypothetical protein AM1BK_45390 [Neobacillus kokaensis]